MAGVTPRAPIRLFLCGDVMIGRGVDQILPQPCDPRLEEAYLSSAEDYVRLAEAASGPIPRGAPLSYIWGAALDELEQMRPDLRIVNLETSVTRSDDFFPKGINYRASPENAACLRAAGIDCCALANNHVLDFGRAGLIDTLDALARLGVARAGAGRDRAEAFAPAVLDLAGEGRVLVFSCACESSGVLRSWAAKDDVSGVALLPTSTNRSVAVVAEAAARHRRESDIVVLSLHRGPNWGYEIAREERDFAHRLIDEAQLSILHCHSSHHALGMEVYRDRLILYGCGDFLNDYEGISGLEEYRADLPLMYFADIGARGELIALAMTPLRIHRLRLDRSSREDVSWLRQTLDRESRSFGAAVELGADGRLALSW